MDAGHAHLGRCVEPHCLLTQSKLHEQKRKPYLYIYLEVLEGVLSHYGTPGGIAQLFQVSIQRDAPGLGLSLYSFEIKRILDVCGFKPNLTNLMLGAPDSSQERRPSVV